MAKSIVENGDKLTTLEDWNNGAVVMWYIVDGASYNDPFGRKPQYQVWNMDKRCYVGSDMKAAYNDFDKQKEERSASYALL